MSALAAQIDDGDTATWGSVISAEQYYRIMEWEYTDVGGPTVSLAPDNANTVPGKGALLLTGFAPTVP